MNDPLDLPLRDIHLPDGVSMWPLAYGWWILIATIILAIIIGIYLYRRAKLARLSAIRRAREEMARIIADYRQTNNPLVLVKEMSILLRRLCISLFPRAEVASLTGAEWLAFLDTRVKGEPFSQGQGRMLLDSPYRKEIESTDVDKFINLCQQWIDAVSRSGVTEA